jgi:putative transposase
MGLAGMAPGPNTSRAHPEHKIYPYLLRGVAVTKPNQVWSTDITYIRLERGFVYLVAIIDWYSRRVLGWRVSNSMDAAFCIDCLEEAIRSHDKPDIFNSDQGSQFTREAFTGVLKREGITISMDGRGRAFDEYLRRAAVAQCQVRGRVSERLCGDRRADDRPGEVLRFL